MFGCTGRDSQWNATVEGTCPDIFDNVRTTLPPSRFGGSVPQSVCWWRVTLLLFVFALLVAVPYSCRVRPLSPTHLLVLQYACFTRACFRNPVLTHPIHRPIHRPIHPSIHTCCALCSNNTIAFLKAFQLSVQTFTTIGYGSIQPATSYTHIIVAFEGFMSLVFASIVGGGIFLKLIKPVPRIAFSDYMVVFQRST